MEPQQPLNQTDITPPTVPTPPQIKDTSSDAPSQPSISELTATPQPQPDQPKEKTDDHRKGGGVVSFAVTIIAAILLTQVINLFFFQSYRVFGESMAPTLSNGDRLIISKVGKTMSKVTSNIYQPKRGEIIVFKSPRDELQLIKRVIGLPGERVVVKSGKITVYNKEKPQGFNPDDAEYGKVLPPGTGNIDVTVPVNHIFVSGDNREGGSSLDSRNELGTVPEENIIGTTSLRLWPLSEAKFF